ncbi:quinone oxidoreductase family protein [Sphingomonas lenta]|uniref:Quinone oxidoreductase n=1 Tax=Sphingomonas lenta TaxID=1141887 RepID=A0A2A2SKF6_9SPHN|nr:quinone oxidoreductase [Sphingomonas lenta]PAX09709.1 quinone oxidoreductase [Sphingomonas lenta]
MERVAMIERTGGPEVIGWREVELPPPGPGEVRMRNTAIGLNYIDTYHRSGIYPVPLPGGLGMEAAGLVEAVGENVDLRPGDRVATFGPSRGAYATARNLPATELFRLPDDVDDRTAAAILLKGCTAEFLIERCAHVRAGQIVLVWAAAGGVGQILVGWLKRVGATVVAVVGTEEKAARVRELGADHVLLHRHEDVAARVREITGGEGADVSLDSVGQASWEASMNSLKRRGLLVSYGNAGGPVTGVNLGQLAAKGSLFVTRPTLFDYYREPGERAAGVERLWSMLRDGAIRPEVGQTFALADAADAHRALEAGETRGSTLLLP